MVISAGLFALALQAAPARESAPPSAVPAVLDCAFAMAEGANYLAPLACLGEDQVKRGQFQDAVATYRKAELAARTGTLKAAALEMLVRLHDAQHLNEPAEVEKLLTLLTAISPADLTLRFRLANIQENRKELDAAESTLHAARRLQPELVEPNKMLAQFYARRVAAMSLAAQQAESDLNTVQPGQQDKDGFYRVGGGVQPPRKTQNGPAYPEAARRAGVSGTVEVEILVDESGKVQSARVTRSVPLLDEAALETVRRWQYEPAHLNGRPIPVKLIVPVSFTLPAQ